MVKAGELCPKRSAIVRASTPEVRRYPEIVRALAEAFHAVTGQEPAYFYKHGALDGGYFNTKIGMPMVMFGSGDPRFAHTDKHAAMLAGGRI